MTSRPSTAAPILAAIAIVVPLVLYVAAYFWRSECHDFTHAIGFSRTYPTQFEKTVFVPAAKFESLLRWELVETLDQSDWAKPDPALQ